MLRNEFRSTCPKGIHIHSLGSGNERSGVTATPGKKAHLPPFDRPAAEPPADRKGGEGFSAHGTYPFATTLWKRSNR
ncbi:hypothetical protein Mal15_34160 [Stieleria maiorica]|uniref:Uncharacterized protein n=1 Tax=Stieleria maiorica TaxID=2795974 RepID=A0A5B9MDM0_9BACT|nr:hypothetical protein Mal15_34160 [Stieleria maiorica]